MDLQNQGGFKWSVHDKDNIERVAYFVPYVPHIKGDTEEHDKFCGHYTSRTKRIKQLCRYCCCPNDDTDNPRAKYKLKNPAMIQCLVDRRELQKLKDLSQHCIDNAWYKIHFGQHNKRGVHGGTVSEMLHAIYLGWFLYLEQCFLNK